MFSDEQFMRRAIDLANLGTSRVFPNPKVGAVIVHENKIIGEGYHQQYGEAHAEVNAVNSVKHPELLKESTIYVTLEPCAHFGKTPPCALLLKEKQFKRVVIGTIDPFAKVAGKGLEILQDAGIECVTNVLKDACDAVNKRFFTFHQQQRPYIILKWAQTMDGFIDALRSEHETGVMRAVSAPETQVLVHQWRSEEAAILVGWKTVLNDNPSLTVRAVHGKNPLRIIIDPQLKAPQHATVFNDGQPTIVLNSIIDKEEGDVRFIKMEDLSPAAQLKKLHELQILSVFIEGGRFTHQQYIDSGLWDEARVIVGQTTFESGTKAPELPFIPHTTKRFSSDTVHYFSNK